MSFLRAAISIAAFLLLTTHTSPVWAQALQKREVRIPYSTTEWATLWMPPELAATIMPDEFGGFLLTLRLDTLAPIVNPATARSYSWGQWIDGAVTVWIYAYDPRASGSPAARIISGIRDAQSEVYREGALSCFQLARNEGTSTLSHCGLNPKDMAYAAVGRCSPTDIGLGNPRCDLRGAFDETFRARFNFSAVERAKMGHKYEALVELLRTFLVK